MKILILDIETSPSFSWMWGLWKEIGSYSFVERDWFIMCWSAKWLGDKKIMSASLPDFPEYRKDPTNDKPMLERLRTLLDEADIVVAHNGIKFDRKKINARFIIHGMKPPSPYRMLDTLQVCRKEFAFTSNRLNDVGQFLKVGKKMDTGGFQLWKDCLTGTGKVRSKAWRKMVEYCKSDIILLEKVYLALRPYMQQHPNVAILDTSGRCSCPKCGSKRIQYRGLSCTNSSTFRRFQCLSCGGWGRQKTNEVQKEMRVTQTTNA
jgi:predicted RNA-binding Zn-ribbon protein involved in translation (DUF1610 family)